MFSGAFSQDFKVSLETFFLGDLESRRISFLLIPWLLILTGRSDQNLLIFKKNGILKLPILEWITKSDATVSYIFREKGIQSMQNSLSSSMLQFLPVCRAALVIFLSCGGWRTNTALSHHSSGVFSQMLFKKQKTSIMSLLPMFRNTLKSS